MSVQRLKTTAAFGEAVTEDSGSVATRYDVGRISHPLFGDLQTYRLPQLEMSTAKCK